MAREFFSRDTDILEETELQQLHRHLGEDFHDFAWAVRKITAEEIEYFHKLRQSHIARYGLSEDSTAIPLRMAETMGIWSVDNHPEDRWLEDEEKEAKKAEKRKVWTIIINRLERGFFEDGIKTLKKNTKNNTRFPLTLPKNIDLLNSANKKLSMADKRKSLQQGALFAKASEELSFQEETQTTNYQTLRTAGIGSACVGVGLGITGAAVAGITGTVAGITLALIGAGIVIALIGAMLIYMSRNFAEEAERQLRFSAAQ